MFYKVVNCSDVMPAENKNTAEAKAKVVAAGWGMELIQFYASLEI